MANYTNKFESSILLRNIKSLTPLNTKRSNTSYLFSFIANHLIYYPTPITTTYAWSFGFLVGMCLVTQMISGIFLAMHYTPHLDLAFSSVGWVMRDVPNGWFLRYIYANGASIFFITSYLCIFRVAYSKFYIQIERSLCYSASLFFLCFLIKIFLNSTLKLQLGVGLFLSVFLVLSWRIFIVENSLLKVNLQFFTSKHYILVFLGLKILYTLISIELDVSDCETLYYTACSPEQKKVTFYNPDTGLCKQLFDTLQANILQQNNDNMHIQIAKAELPDGNRLLV